MRSRLLISLICAGGGSGYDWVSALDLQTQLSAGALSGLNSDICRHGSQDVRFRIRHRSFPLFAGEFRADPASRIPRRVARDD